MKKIVVALASLGLLAGSVVASSPAIAGALSSGGITVTWDESRFYVPNGCSTYSFTVQTDGNVNVGEIKLLTRYGDSLGSAYFFDPYRLGTPTTSQETIRICATPDQSKQGEVILQLDVAKFVGTGGDIVAEMPIVLQPRVQPTPAPEATTPEANTPAATAKPQPKKSVKCISKKSFKKKTFKGKGTCPKGWVNISD